MTETNPGECGAATQTKKCVVVTGASSGIGAAIAREFALAGCDVFLHARSNEEGLDRVAAEVREAGGQTKTYLADLSRHSRQDELLEQAWEWRETIAVWVNNAGADVLTGPAAELTFEEKLELLWRVDVEATVRLSRRAGANMQRQNNVAAVPLLLNMGWDQAERGMGGDSGEMFAAIKGAVMAFSRSLAMSLAPRVRVNCLAPGWIATSWAARSSAYWRDRAESESLLRRWGQPEDVARAAVFLASKNAEFINAHVLPVNGGFRSEAAAKKE